jgi:PTH1 family peptidyl-tRNA hydrolase
MTPPALRILAGLGNPGEEYARSRHNAGYRLVDFLAREAGLLWTWEKRFQADTALLDVDGRPLLLVKPRTFMNRSGESLGKLARYYRLQPEQFAVAYDDTTVDAGRSKLSLSGGSGGHNGVESVLRHLGSGFARLRIGIGGKSHRDMVLADYVLGKFSAEEEQTLVDQLPRLAEGVRLLVREGPERCMNWMNIKAKAS